MTNKCDQVSITTLGSFDVFKGGQSLISMHPGSKKIWELFKFMLTYRGRSFTPEALVEALWPTEDYADPRGALRRQMHRLRQFFHESGAEHQCGTLIIFKNGYYQWNSDSLTSVDCELFEKAIEKADSFKKSDPSTALQHYREAVSLYHGEYLPDCSEHQWVFSVRNLYRRLFLKAILALGELTSSQKDYQAFLPICEKAIQLDYYEEDFHLLYMNTLMHVGEKKTALQHYEQITGFLYHEMGIKPSSAMKSMYKRILSTQEVHNSLDSLHAELEKSTTSETAFFCEPTVFRSIYELEWRRSERDGYQTVIGLLTIAASVFNESLDKNMLKDFGSHLIRSLRKGDVVTKWNNTQFLVLLPGLTEDLMNQVISRILTSYSHITETSPSSVAFEIRQVLPPQNIISNSANSKSPTVTKHSSDA
ncbi:BTAD domain-containing putative transcriptional regulator [Tindallia californiensis]|uniref:DNA-binding transcriptional activator of the SARP family n=1 Tax=Tindallia californiensis TaxID=159292 RepID=A0A1H3MUY2_9FIRM|nr:BTAD domain-containing putative transcriptional regulator [Tindallia californiensis]SDY80386.1 DNA-binding transcriptional activator of the SARP family [Tindallia californiensis]